MVNGHLANMLIYKRKSLFLVPSSISFYDLLVFDTMKNHSSLVDICTLEKLKLLHVENVVYIITNLVKYIA